VRIFLYSLIGIPLLFVDGVLIFTLPVRLAQRFTLLQGGFLVVGAAAYFAVHFLLRKPERLYLWGHELTHLVVAKLFFRQVHGFHITSRSGGKVVIDRTNVAIDIAPYAVPIYCLASLALALLFGGGHRYAGEIYLAVAAFFFTMHLYFSVEGFLHGQPDLRRSGRLFSAAVILLFLLLWVPFLGAPGTRAGFHGLPSFYREWLGGGWTATRRLLSFCGVRVFF
jgi:hypothetical protein